MQCDAYKTADELLNEITRTPEIHIVFKDSGDVLDVILSTYAGQYKGTIHHQHRQKHNLQKGNKTSIYLIFMIWSR